jgi:hypothetical protein
MAIPLPAQKYTPLSLVIRLTKRDGARHTLAYERRDGQGETLVRETRGVLFRGLLHFAIESEAWLAASFYRSLARGNMGVSLIGEAAASERIVAVLTGRIEPEAASALAIRGAKLLFEESGEGTGGMTTEFVARAHERLRRLTGDWKTLPVDGAMKLEFPPEA